MLVTMIVGFAPRPVPGPGVETRHRFPRLSVLQSSYDT